LALLLAAVNHECTCQPGPAASPTQAGFCSSGSPPAPIGASLPLLLAPSALAFAASWLAGMLPAWRAMQVTPAIQLKSQ